MNEDIQDTVRRKYGEAATAAARGQSSSCCGSSCGDGAATKDPITRELYAANETAGLPEEALLASFGCGNPTALAELHAGETVLDLGSGGGIDVLLSARRVGPTGKAYGLDMTPAMLELARANQRKAGTTNVEFLEGSIESVPLPDRSIDVVISNCVINLSTDKQRVLREAFRVLRPGGRFAVSDVVLRRSLPPELSSSMRLWTGCVAGALLEDEYRRFLAEAGFVDVDIELTRVFDRAAVEEMARATNDEVSGCSSGDVAAALDGAIASAFVRARKP